MKGEENNDSVDESQQAIAKIVDEIKKFTFPYSKYFPWRYHWNNPANVLYLHMVHISSETTKIEL